MPMPGSVKLALAALAIPVLALLGIAAASVRAGVSIPFQIPLTILLMLFLGWSIARRKRLAWLWGRYVGFFLTVASLLIGALAVRDGAPLVGVLLLAAIAVPFLAVSLLFGRTAVHRWFAMVCPECAAVATRGDLLMRSLRCPRCGETF